MITHYSSCSKQRKPLSAAHRPVSVDSEHCEQVALFEWAAMVANRYPDLALMYAVPNGGHRHPATAARLKAEGVKSGVPDIHLPVPRWGYHGLWIEMKRRSGGTVSPAQKDWKSALERQGHRVEICRGFEAAKAAIEEYLR